VKTDDSSQEFLAREGFASSSFHYTGFPRRLSWSALAYPGLTLAAFAAARRIVHRERPDVFLGMGGYVSVPVGWAAHRRRVPLVLHEQNSVAGLANRLLSRWARTVALTFEGTEGLSSRARLSLTGLPLRPDLSPRDPAASRRALGLEPERFTLLVFGGSQGARALNRLVIAALERTPIPDLQVVHLAGAAEAEAVRDAHRTAGRPAFVQGFFNDMATAYSAADFVIGRAGANSVMELARMGPAALLVPFPFATDDHQAANARILATAGQATIVRESELTADRLSDILRALPPRDLLRAENERRRAAVSSDLESAAQRVADRVEEAAR
jgi:UDP-N-acetylglucosamine--N-acetylmuramyl-(pentapeptide) pyrophosphoryl-undecaprenol N-acetylglucosamine transferase